MVGTSAGQASSVDNIVARLERLPISWWHVKTRIIIGVATFFDAFDALAIASVLPVIVPIWKLRRPQIGLLDLGRLRRTAAGRAVVRLGRRALRADDGMVWSIGMFAVMSFVCAFAWDYDSLLVFRTIQGIGLGGEVPIAAVYISEIATRQGPRPLRAALRAGFSGRSGGAEPASASGSCRISAGNTCS